MIKRIILILAILLLTCPAWAGCKDDVCKKDPIQLAGMFTAVAGAGGAASTGYTCTNAAPLDAFGRADENLDYGNWAAGSGWTTAKLVSTAATGPTGNLGASYWAATAFNDNQGVQGKVVDIGDGYTGIGVRISITGSTKAAYYLRVFAASTQLRKNVGATETLLATLTRDNSVNECWKLTATGGATTTLNVYVDATCTQSWGSVALTYDDSSSPITTGQIGIAGYEDNALWDNFCGGNL